MLMTIRREKEKIFDVNIKKLSLERWSRKHEKMCKMEKYKIKRDKIL